MPLQPGEWGKGVARHPDKEDQAYLMRAMREGFQVGLKYGKSQCQSATVNMKSATDNPTVVAEYLEKERIPSTF